MIATGADTVDAFRPILSAFTASQDSCMTLLEEIADEAISLRGQAGPAAQERRAVLREGVGGVREVMRESAEAALHALDVLAPPPTQTFVATAEATIPGGELHLTVPIEVRIEAPPAPVLHVAPPNVTVEASQPAQVTVTPQIEVHMPEPRARRTRVIRDLDGRVTSVESDG